MSARSGLVMTAAQIVAHYERLGMDIPSVVYEAIRPAIVDDFSKKGGVTILGKLRQPKQPNKTEAEFEMILKSRRLQGNQESYPEFTNIKFEGVRLKLADGLTYTPDFMCQRTVSIEDDIGFKIGSEIVFFEVKGRHKWDDAIAKFKMAKNVHDWAHFEMWQKLNGHWNQIY